MESHKRYLLKHGAVYSINGWYWGEDADFGPESFSSIFLGTTSEIAAEKLKRVLKEMGRDDGGDGE